MLRTEKVGVIGPVIIVLSALNGAVMVCYHVVALFSYFSLLNKNT